MGNILHGLIDLNSYIASKNGVGQFKFKCYINNECNIDSRREISVDCSNKHYSYSTSEAGDSYDWVSCELTPNSGYYVLNLVANEWTGEYSNRTRSCTIPVVVNGVHNCGNIQIYQAAFPPLTCEDINEEGVVNITGLTFNKTGETANSYIFGSYSIDSKYEGQLKADLTDESGNTYEVICQDGVIKLGRNPIPTNVIPDDDTEERTFILRIYDYYDADCQEENIIQEPSIECPDCSNIKEFLFDGFDYEIIDGSVYINIDENATSTEVLLASANTKGCGVITATTFPGANEMFEGGTANVVMSPDEKRMFIYGQLTALPADKPFRTGAFDINYTSFKNGLFCDVPMFLKQQKNPCGCNKFSIYKNHNIKQYIEGIDYNVGYFSAADYGNGCEFNSVYAAYPYYPSGTPTECKNKYKILGEFVFEEGVDHWINAENAQNGRIYVSPVLKNDTGNGRKATLLVHKYYGSNECGTTEYVYYQMSSFNDCESILNVIKILYENGNIQDCFTDIDENGVLIGEKQIGAGGTALIKIPSFLGHINYYTTDCTYCNYTSCGYLSEKEYYFAMSSGHGSDNDCYVTFKIDLGEQGECEIAKVHILPMNVSVCDCSTIERYSYGKSFYCNYLNKPQSFETGNTAIYFSNVTTSCNFKLEAYTCDANGNPKTYDWLTILSVSNGSSYYSVNIKYTCIDGLTEDDVAYIYAKLTDSEGNDLGWTCNTHTIIEYDLSETCLGSVNNYTLEQDEIIVTSVGTYTIGTVTITNSTYDISNMKDLATCNVNSTETFIKDGHLEFVSNTNNELKYNIVVNVTELPDLPSGTPDTWAIDIYSVSFCDVTSIGRTVILKYTAP